MSKGMHKKFLLIGHVCVALCAFAVMYALSVNADGVNVERDQNLYLMLAIVIIGAYTIAWILRPKKAKK